MGEEKNVMKEVCGVGEKGGAASASELEPMKSEMGQARAEMLLLPMKYYCQKKKKAMLILYF